jgi:hypothetical protein
MKSTEIRLQKLENRMRRNPEQMSETERDAQIDAILKRVGLSYEGLLRKYGTTAGILRAIAQHWGSLDRFTKGEPPIRQGDLRHTGDRGG